jgi:DNA-binding response OmpR family regulator
MHILVAEDDIAFAQTLRAMLARWDHGVEIAASGENALERLRRSEFDLILLDIFLPDLKGYELIPHFKEIRPDIGIVTMTGHNSRELEMRIRRLGILYYMIKPFETRFLRSLLEHIAQRRDQ